MTPGQVDWKGRSLGDPDVAVDDGFEYETRSEELFDLLADFAVLVLPPVKKSREDENLQRWIVGLADGSDGLEQLAGRGEATNENPDTFQVALPGSSKTGDTRKLNKIR